ncbi:astacin-like metalloprotease toxin 5 isoform X2 [Panonychus citri]|uniref:astacin-like metalloprotease toxin 5 isoform X2 n=1 Tax=Panonychus citri TaxID=50023 RepID=UPI00230721DE|nr:astacin-like metalloprotease toxin 5 isoform X2 [Panonychus citri]
MIKLFSLIVIFSTQLNFINSIPEKQFNPLENPNLFLGDIKIKSKSTGNKQSLQNAITNNNQLWTNNLIPFEIDDNLSDAYKLIYNSLLLIQSKTCIRFKYRTDESDYIKYTYDEGCYSYVGRSGGEQLISLGDGCWCQGTVIHETMHSIGFYHEQNRSDRDDFIIVNLNNVIPGLGSQFIKLRPEQNRLLTDYDYDSLMHYSDTAFSISADLKTMVPKKQGATLVHQCFKPFSPKDIEKINKLYNCTN